MTVAPAPDDIVATHAEAERNDRVPLLVLEPLAAFLDEPGLRPAPHPARPGGGPRRASGPTPPRPRRAPPPDRPPPGAPGGPRGRRPPPPAPAAAPQRARR